MRVTKGSLDDNGNAGVAPWRAHYGDELNDILYGLLCIIINKKQLNLVVRKLFLEG